jgi:hypothetical protein
MTRRTMAARNSVGWRNSSALSGPCRVCQFLNTRWRSPCCCTATKVDLDRGIVNLCPLSEALPPFDLAPLLRRWFFLCTMPKLSDGSGATAPGAQPMDCPERQRELTVNPANCHFRSTRVPKKSLKACGFRSMACRRLQNARPLR